MDPYVQLTKPTQSSREKVAKKRSSSVSSISPLISHKNMHQTWHDLHGLCVGKTGNPGSPAFSAAFEIMG